MSKLVIEIEMENAAFEDGEDGMLEAARIVRGWLNAGASDDCKLRDSNGNTVGSVEVTG